jgi:hypothetical protein
VATIADFENEADFARAFTFFQEPVDFAKAPYVARPDWRPPRLDRVATDSAVDGGAGKYALRSEQRGTEETCFAGLRLVDTAEANALVFDMRAEHADAPEAVVDFVVYAAPRELRMVFPWDSLRPPLAWRHSPDAFTYYLGEDRVPDASYAFYHARRTIPTGRATTLVVPLADFICAYGRNEAAGLFRNQRPLSAEMLLAIGWTAPFGARRAPTVLLIDNISFARVPGEAGDLHSYPQQIIQPKP